LKKKIRILVPTYNEQENIEELVQTVCEYFEESLKDYDFFIHIQDNKSTDKTREIVKRLAKENNKVKAIFNANNFGLFNSQFYGLIANDIGEKSDATIIFAADFQDPVDMIGKFIAKWEEEGHQVVVGVKTKSKESKIMRFFRTRYYKLIKKMSSIEQIPHFTGFAIYDNTFIETLKKLDDPIPFLRGLVAEFCPNHGTIEYTQEKRKRGKSSYNFPRLYDVAMTSITTYTKRLPRYATIWGAIMSFVSFMGLVALGVLRVFFDQISFAYIGLAAVGFFAFLNMFFIGILGEYLVTMNTRLINRPLVIEEERVGYDESQKG